MPQISGPLRKVRGLFGLGVIGAAVGLVAGPIADVLLRLVSMAIQGAPDVPSLGSFILASAASAAADWALLGGFTGMAFGTLLAVTDRKRTLEQLPTWRMGLLGAIGGAAFLGVYVLLQGPPRPVLDMALFAAVGVASALGACLTTSMVALAKRARRREIASREGLPSPSETEEV